MDSAVEAPPSPDIPPDLLFLQPFSFVSPPDPIRPLLSLDSDLVLAEAAQGPLVKASLAGSGLVSKTSSAHGLPNPVASSLWVNKVKASFHPLFKVASPVVSEDGIPSVKAPDSISLGSSIFWKDYLVAFFHGNPPTLAKIFSDLNPIWGKKGRISIKRHSDHVCMIFIPCPITRQWALDAGLWQSGNCSFSVSAWQPGMDLSPKVLLNAPVWALFRRVPQELWSIEGFSTMASGVGEPMHSEFPELKPYSNGIIKLKVLVELGKKLPPMVRVSDKDENSVLVAVEYPRLPPTCRLCNGFGHYEPRCPSSLARQNLKKTPIAPSIPALRLDSSSMDRSPADGENNLVCSKSVYSPRDSEKDSPSGSKLRRSKSLPSPSADPSDVGDSLALQDLAIGVFRSSPPALSDQDSSLPRPSVPLNNSQFAEEEELIQRHSTTAPVSEKEVSSPNTLLGSIVDPSDDTMVDDLISLATISVLENMVSEPAPTFVYINEVIESPISETAQISTVSDTLIVQANSTVENKSRRIAEPDYGSNKFASLISLEVEEDSSDSDIEMDLMDLMTPTGKRILRERPVKPSAKVRDMHMQSTVRGRGTRGRGSRGGRG